MCEFRLKSWILPAWWGRLDIHRTIRVMIYVQRFWAPDSSINKTCRICSSSESGRMHTFLSVKLFSHEEIATAYTTSLSADLSDRSNQNTAASAAYSSALQAGDCEPHPITRTEVNNALEVYQQYCHSAKYSIPKWSHNYFNQPDKRKQLSHLEKRWVPGCGVSRERLGLSCI